MKKLLFTSVFVFSLILLGACGSDNNNAGGEGNGDSNDGDKSKLEQLQEEGVIKVGFADEKPYGYENDEGEQTGASIDTAKAVFKELGIDTVEGQLADRSEEHTSELQSRFDL